MKNINDLIKDVAFKADISEDLASLFLRYYWRDIRNRIGSKTGCFINVGGFGLVRFNAVASSFYMFKKSKKIKYYQERLLEEGISDDKKLRYFQKIALHKYDARQNQKLYEIFKQRVGDKEGGYYGRINHVAESCYEWNKDKFSMEEFEPGEEESYIKEKTGMPEVSFQRKAYRPRK